jgi:ribosome-binding protein aMBF1 (putative translation factor)
MRLADAEHGSGLFIHLDDPFLAAWTSAPVYANSRSGPARIGRIMPRESQRRTVLRARAERELRLTFGHNVRAERLRRGMSQAELGEECGLLQEYVSAVESGRLNLTIGTMVRIALALETEVLRLLRRRR